MTRPSAANSTNTINTACTVSQIFFMVLLNVVCTGYLDPIHPVAVADRLLPIPNRGWLGQIRPCGESAGSRDAHGHILTQDCPRTSQNL